MLDISEARLPDTHNGMVPNRARKTRWLEIRHRQFSRCHRRIDHRATHPAHYGVVLELSPTLDPGSTDAVENHAT